MEDISFTWDRTKMSPIYKKPGNTDRARSHEEVAGDSNPDGKTTGLATKKPMCPSSIMGLYDE